MPIRRLPGSLGPPEERAVDVVARGARALFEYEMQRARIDPEATPYVWARVEAEYTNKARVVLEPPTGGTT